MAGFPESARGNIVAEAGDDEGRGRLLKRVLIVEDDPLIQALYRSIFRKHGDEFSCQYKGSGEDALPFLAHARVDAMILDWDLPGIDGLTILRAIRMHPVTSALPVFMITGRDDALSRQVAMASGASDYAVKGVDVEELLARLRLLTS